MADIQYFTYNGIKYEIFALCGNSHSESISFNEFKSSMPDGVVHQALFGPRTGLKSFSLEFENLNGTLGDVAVTIYGRDTNAADYLWDLFCRSKVSGKPFIVVSPRNGQYYLVSFTESANTFQKKLNKIYSASIKIQQQRVKGVSVFQESFLSWWANWKSEDIAQANNTILNTWVDSSSGLSRTLTSVAPGTIHNKFLTNQQNTYPAVSLNVATSDSYMECNTAVTIKQLFIVVKIREATFSNTAGVVTAGNSDSPILVGNTGTARFFDLGFAGLGDTFFYEKNGVSFEESNQQAPMNQFGVVYVHHVDGLALTKLVIGKDRAFGGRYAIADYIQIAIPSTPLLESDAYEYVDHLLSKYKIS